MKWIQEGRIHQNKTLIGAVHSENLVGIVQEAEPI